MNTNLNFVWTTIFVKRLEKLGVRYVCISPGSRNTPLTLAFAESKKIKSFVFADERQSAFFALGLAKKTSLPAAIVTTSGTATAEVYPAIIEAYQTCTPLLVCTADRPAYLQNTGSNQTINQDNLYKNHINFFADLRLPKLSDARLNKLIKTTDKAFSIARQSGPVHLNFPFEKPLEPWAFNSIFTETKLNYYIGKEIYDFPKKSLKIPHRIFTEIEKARKVLILLGGNLPEKTSERILSFANNMNFPVFVDGTNGARFSKNNRNVISYASFIVLSNLQKFKPDLIISFGKAPTTNSILTFYEKSNAVKILVNSKGRINDPSKTHTFFLNVNEQLFIDEMEKKIPEKDFDFLKHFLDAENRVANKIERFTKNKGLKFEGNIVRTLLRTLPVKSILFLGNSTIPRDFDLFSGKISKMFSVYSNRGASGIDGIISTAAGIAKSSAKRIYLYIGDLSFYYDINFLHYLNEMKIPLTIILQNNNGGGIFEMLPVAEKRKHFNKYFKVPLNIDFKKLTEAYGVQYFSVNSEDEFRSILSKNINKEKNSLVIEINSYAEYSNKLRKKIIAQINKLLTENF